MTSSIDALRLRRVMSRRLWGVPEPYGPDGWLMVAKDGRASIIVSCSTHETDPDHEWLHASIARVDGMPTYDDLVLLHHAVWGDTGYAYQVFVPATEHVNIHEHALHLWGRRDGTDVLPKFGMTLVPGVRSI